MATRIRTAAIASAIGLFVGVIGAALFALNPRAAASQLSASWKTIPGGIGIPGLTKTYRADLTNRGALPVRISVCDSINDALKREKNIAYSVERWDGRTKEWRFLREIPASEFCKPYSLGIVRGEIRGMWLWPRHIISTGFIAIQASEGLDLNDRLRFAITPFLPRRDVRIVTPPFTVDERPTDSDVNFRIAH
jgi:hypothetical protein